jgi:hypothetical protein
MPKLLKFDYISKTKCRLHGNVCSSVSNDLTKGTTTVYTDCSCTRQYRSVGNLSQYYPTDDVILATVATFVAASDAHGSLSMIRDVPDYLYESEYYYHDHTSKDDERMSHLECLREKISGYVEDAETAAADAAAAATPGDAEHARYVNVARMAAESAKVAQNAMALAVDAATAKIALRKATDKAIDAAKKADASSAISNRAAFDLRAAVVTASTAADIAANTMGLNARSKEKASMEATLAARKVATASRKAANASIATVTEYAAYAAAANDAVNASDAAMVADKVANDAAKAAKAARAAAEAAATAADLGVCAVCYKGSRWDETSCGHSVCSLCVKNWTLECNKKRAAPTCPLCREPLA